MAKNAKTVASSANVDATVKGKINGNGKEAPKSNETQATDAFNVIHELMFNAKGDGERQYRLVSYMFDDAANYAKEYLDKYFKASGGDKVAFVDQTLAKMSDEYAIALKAFNEASMKGNKDVNRKEKKATALAEMQPVREMLKRANHCLLVLRATDNVISFVKKDDGRYIATTKTVDEKTKKDVYDATPWQSMREMTKTGLDMAAKLYKPVATRKATTKLDPNAINGANAKDFAEHLVKTLKPREDGKPLLETLKDDEAKAVDQLFVHLLKLHFEHNGEFKTAEMAEFIRENLGAKVDGKGPKTMSAKEAENMRAKGAPKKA